MWSRALLAAVLFAAASPTGNAYAGGGHSAAVGSLGVMAFIDSGINPYHVAFRDSSPLAHVHPVNYIEGFPADAIALEITLDAPTYKEAVARDCELWRQVVPGRLYWFPGTRIIGAISFSPVTRLSCHAPNVKILDTEGHGTMVASRGASGQYGGCRNCRIVAVQFPLLVDAVNRELSAASARAALNWTTQNASWIDAQSNSWGPYLPAWEPTGAAGSFTSDPELVRAVENASSTHLAFWASGNGAAFRGGVLSHPTLITPHLTPSAIIVGGHDSGYVITWSGSPPHVVSDACSSWAARASTLDGFGDSVGGGTSAATPYAAAGAVAILIEARRILEDTETGVDDDVVARGPRGLVPTGPLADGIFTLWEWRRVIFLTATARPMRQFEDGPPCELASGAFAATPLQWKDVPAEYPEFLNIGYGAVDSQSIQLAGDVLSGIAQAPDRSRTDTYFDIDRSLRSSAYQVFSASPQ